MIFYPSGYMYFSGCTCILVTKPKKIVGCMHRASLVPRSLWRRWRKVAFKYQDFQSHVTNLVIYPRYASQKGLRSETGASFSESSILVRNSISSRAHRQSTRPRLSLRGTRQHRTKPPGVFYSLLNTDHTARKP